MLPYAVYCYKMNVESSSDHLILKNRSETSFHLLFIQLEIVKRSHWRFSFLHDGTGMLKCYCHHGGVQSMIFFFIWETLLVALSGCCNTILNRYQSHSNASPVPMRLKLIISAALPHLIWTNFLKSLDLGSASTYCAGWDYVPGKLCFSPLVLLCWITDDNRVRKWK